MWSMLIVYVFYDKFTLISLDTNNKTPSVIAIIR